MNSKYRSLRIRKIAVAATVASLAFGSVVIPPTAAAKVVVGTVESLNPTDIDLNEVGKVTIIKPESNPFGSGADVPRSIAGREIVIQRLGGVEINTVDGFRNAQSLTLEEAQKLPVEAKFSKETNSQGIAVFEGLTPGLYVLGEPQPADKSKAYYTTSPELFMLPVGDGDYWAYNFQLETKDQLEPGPTPATIEPSSSSGSSGLLPLLIPIIIGGIALGSASGGALVPPPAAAPAPPTSPPPPKPAPPILARTGADAVMPFAIGILSMLLGGALVVRRRRAMM